MNSFKNRMHFSTVEALNFHFGILRFTNLKELDNDIGVHRTLRRVRHNIVTVFLP